LFDEVLVYKKNWTTHLVHVDYNSSIITYYSSNILCYFSVSEVEYFGDIFSGKEMHVKPNKIEEMIDWNHPNTLKGFHGFLGVKKNWKPKGYIDLKISSKGVLQLFL